MSVRFDDRVAIVTGAGGDLGRAEAMGLAARGAKVLVNDIGRDPGGGARSEPAERVAAEIVAAGGEALAYACDVADPAQVQAMAAAAMDRWGRIDILINNAGVLKDSSFGKMTLEQFRQVVEVNLMGSVICCKAVWPHMLAAGYGRILMTTSSSGLYGSYRQANYASAKMGLVGLMSTLQIEGEKAGIRVNALAPSAATNMNAALLPANVKPYLKIEAVTPAALYLVCEDAPRRTILSAMGGGFSRIFVQESEGLVLPPEAWTPEAIAASFQEISGERGERYLGSYEQLMGWLGRVAERREAAS